MDDSQDNPEQATGDQTRRFLFEQADIRGESVRLDTAFRDILAIHQYAPGVSRQLGELLAAAVLLSSTLKFEGKLVLQARSQGQIPLLMAECSSTGEVRGIARGAELATASQFEQLLGEGSLAITIDPREGQRYQGIAPLSGESLAQCLDAYFEQSEQLGTRFWLAADEQRAAGLLLQQLPAQLTTDPQERAQQWEHACALAATIAPQDLLELSTEQLLYRLYHEDALRLFAPAPVVVPLQLLPGAHPASPVRHRPGRNREPVAGTGQHHHGLRILQPAVSLRAGRPAAHHRTGPPANSALSVTFADIPGRYSHFNSQKLSDSDIIDAPKKAQPLIPLARTLPARAPVMQSQDIP